MSRYVTPFVAINLGVEMVFVVAQRLQAQNVEHERSAFVLDEIVSVLISQQLITEITKPQAAYSHEAVKDLIEDVAQSSAMRLDSKSMDKLWDLITMVYKWQLTLSSDIIKLTSRHLYEIENYVTTEETQLNLHKIQNLFDNYSKILTSQEQKELRDHVLVWLDDFNVKVSLLLRLGLQDSDGSFITENLDNFAQDMLRNLGENIYNITHVAGNDRSVEKKEHEEEEKTDNEGFELKLFVDQIVGERKNSQQNALKLAINSTSNQVDKGMLINIETVCNKIDTLFDDVPEGEVQDYYKDLINMLDK